MRKTVALFCAVFLAFALCACGDSSDKTYDSDFLADFVRGLEARWVYADSEKEAEQKEAFIEAVDIELRRIEKYNDLPFADSALREKALAYIDELHSGLTVLSTFGGDAFYTDWAAHTDRRKQLIVEINEMHPLAFGEEHQSTFEEFVSRGLEVMQDSEKAAAANVLVDQFKFVALGPEFEGSLYIAYEAVVENVTEFDFEAYSVAIDLIDSNGVVMKTTYCYVDNWTAGKRVKTDFMTDVEFTSLEVALEFFS